MGRAGDDGAGPDATLSVLVVDDEPEIADLVATYLERVDESLHATGVTDPETALDRVREGSFDGVVSDYHMPSMDGLTLLERVEDVAPAAARILYSSDDARPVIREADRADVTFVHKRMRRERYARIASHVRRERGGSS